MPLHQRWASIQEGYDQWSATYDGDGNPLIATEELVLVPIFARLASRLEGSQALDVGSGTGRNCERLLKYGVSHVTCLDISQGMLRRARELHGESKQVTQIHHDITRQPFPFEPASFDLVASCLVLGHLSPKEQEPVLQEFCRVLRPGGMVLISVQHPYLNSQKVLARFYEKDTCVSVGDIPTHNISNYVMCLKELGLELLHMGEHSPPPAVVQAVPRARKYKDVPNVLLLVAQKPLDSRL